MIDLYVHVCICIYISMVVCLFYAVNPIRVYKNINNVYIISVKRRGTNGQTMIYKTLHRKPKI